jgi:peptide/nickel transport system ATP-binding protein
VSFLYITHDLATAFYLADDLIIMQSGEIVERGKPVDILSSPEHDYTRLLISSVPRIGDKWEELGQQNKDKT